MVCADCTCGRAQDPGRATGPGRAEQSAPAPTESFEQIRREVRSFTSPEDAFQFTEGVQPAVPLRSKKWFNDPSDPGTFPFPKYLNPFFSWCSCQEGFLGHSSCERAAMSALYIERYLNSGTTLSELHPTNKPIIGIAQTGSDLAPCNRHHIQLAKRVREGIIAAGGTAMEFPCHPIQETGKRPTASLDRNLSYLSLVEVLFGYPLDGVVLLTGCDKT